MNSSSKPTASSGACLRLARGFGGMLGRLSRISSPILACAWYGLIYVLSSGPTGSRIGPISGSWMLNTGHSLLFGLLALWIVLGLPRADGWPVVKPSSVAFVLGLVLILGALDELHQGTVAGRSMSAADVLTDLTGATCVLWICAYSGSAAAGERGLRTRLGLAIAACFAAGGIATLSDDYLG